MSQPLQSLNVYDSKPDQISLQRHKQGRSKKRGQDTENDPPPLETRIADTRGASIPEASIGPTSFAGLITNHRTEVPLVNLQQLQPPPAVVRRIKTFQDVAAAKINSTKHIEDEGRIVLSQSNWLPPPLIPNQAGPGSSKHPPPSTLSQNSAPLQSPPFDWSLKRSVKFLSDKPFLLHKETITASRGDVLLAERCFVSGGVPSFPSTGPTTTTPRLSPQAQQLIAACMSWQYPQDCRAPPSSGDGRSRRGAWQESLCSLYDAFRHGECPFFYVTYRTPPGNDSYAFERKTDHKGRPLCTVFFGTSGINGRSRVHALMSRSTAGLRTVFRQQGIGFEMPLMGGSNKENKNHHGNGGEGTRSLLIFRGVLQVHALFDFVLNRGVSNAGLFGDGESDLPLLLSPVHFTNASLHKYHLECLESSWGHQLEVRGDGAPIPPWVADRLFCALCDGNCDDDGNDQSATITLVCESRTDTGALNWYDDGCSQSLAVSNIPNPFFACAKEHIRWSSCCPGLNTVALREIKYSDGVFTIAKTTEKVAPAC